MGSTLDGHSKGGLGCVTSFASVLLAGPLSGSAVPNAAALVCVL